MNNTAYTEKSTGVFSDTGLHLANQKSSNGVSFGVVGTDKKARELFHSQQPVPVVEDPDDSVHLIH